MPLHIPSTPTATPAGMGATPASGAATHGLAALFSLLLAQTVSPAAPAGAAAPIGKQAVTVHSLVTDTKAAVTSAPAAQGVPAKAASTDKPTPKGRADPPVFPWPLMPPVMALLVPSGNKAPVTPKKVMDTAPTTGSESPLLPKMVPSVRTNVLVPTEPRVIVPAEPVPTGAVPVAATPRAPMVPFIAAQQAEAVSLTAPPTPIFPPAVSPAGMPAFAAVAFASAGNAGPGAAPSAPASPPTTARGPRRTASAAVVSAPVLQKPAGPADNQPGIGPGKNAGLADAATPLTDTPPVVKAQIKVGGQTPPRASAEGAATGPAPPGPASPVMPSVTPFALTGARIAVTPMPPADRTQMLRQVSEGLQTMAVRAAGSGRRQVTLQLHPKDWGRVNVSVTMTPTTQADGRVTTQVVAHVVADQPSVKAALETHQADLRSSLKGAGLNLDRMTVTVRPAEGGAQAALGDGRRESRGGEGNTPGQPQNTGTAAHGGTFGDGGRPSAFAAFGQGTPGGQGRQPTAPQPEQAVLSAERETAAQPALTQAGRVDTRA